MPNRRSLQLTQARRGWAQARGGAQFKGKELRYNAGVESRYVQALTALSAQMATQYRRELLRLFNSGAAATHFAADAASPGPGANIGSQARILLNSLQKRFDALFTKKAGVLAQGMVTSATAASQTALHTSLKELTGGMSLKTSLMTTQLKNVYSSCVAVNVQLIKTIPAEYHAQVSQAVFRSITSGNGLQDLVPALEKYDGYSHRKAKNVALDQTRKTYNAINEGRMRGIGVRKFQWIHSGGGAHPREDHIAMDGKIYSFDNPPVIDRRTGERGIPGQAINCRCTMAPVFDFSDSDDDSKRNDSADD